MKWLKRLGLLLILLYACMCLTLYLLQERIIFDPHPLSENFQFRTGTEMEVEVEPGISLNCLLLEEPQAKGVILYLHGTRGNIRRCIRQAQSMMNNQYDIFIPDYRGYGKSDGAIHSEAQFYGDMQEVYNYLKTQYAEEQIVLLGYSLGTGLAARLAANNNPQQLILVAPFLSMIDLKNRMFYFVPDFLVKYPLKLEEDLDNIQCPITLVHGTSDSIIPFDSSEKLKARMPQTTNLVPIQQAGHRGVIFSGILKETIRKLLM